MSSTIKYQGRRARRESSKQRRRDILEATLRIIIRDGIRAVRHRAVAAEAGVPLSATTYYFKDIADLIADAFTLFAEQTLAEVVRPFQVQALHIIKAMPAALTAENKDELIQQLAEALSAYVLQGVNRRENIVAEHAFFQEAMMDERLTKVANLFFAGQIQVLVDACQSLQAPHPIYAAELLYNQIVSWERTLILNANAYTESELEQRICYLLRMVLAA